MNKQKSLTTLESIALVLLVSSVLLVLPVFGPPVILTGSALAIVGCMLVYYRHHRQSVLVPVSLTAGLTVLAAVSLFGP